LAIFREITRCLC